MGEIFIRSVLEFDFMNEIILRALRYLKWNMVNVALCYYQWQNRYWSTNDIQFSEILWYEFIQYHVNDMFTWVVSIIVIHVLGPRGIVVSTVGPAWPTGWVVTTIVAYLE